VLSLRKKIRCLRLSSADPAGMLVVEQNKIRCNHRLSNTVPSDFTPRVSSKTGTSTKRLGRLEGEGTMPAPCQLISTAPTRSPKETISNCVFRIPYCVVRFLALCFGSCLRLPPFHPFRVTGNVVEAPRLTALLIVGLHPCSRLVSSHPCSRIECLFF